MQNNMDPALTGESPDLTGGGGGGNKRKSEEGGPTQQRAKRNRYISIACNECKRRKIKCNGNQPCQRCGSLNLECVYAPNCCGTNFKDTEEYRRMNAQIMALQAQVDALYADLSSLRSDLAHNNPPLDPSLQHQPYDGDRPNMGITSPGLQSPGAQRSRPQPGPRHSTFRGITSADYSFGVAKNSLQTMGITPGLPNTEDGTRDGSPSGTPPPGTHAGSNKDPIWAVSREEALRLLKVYEDEIHELYPIVSIPKLAAHIESLYKFMEASIRTGLVLTHKPGGDAINDEDTNILKLVLASAMISEGSGKSELGQQIFDYVQPQVDSLLLGNAGVKDVKVLALTAIYVFHCDDEGTSWRVIGLTARLCIELGLHRSETYNKMSSEDRDNAMLLFWSVYVLDRRWSFGTGMPFALQDSDLDPQLPRPGDKSPYLNAMIEFCSISAKVWQSIGVEHSGIGSHDGTTKEQIRYLDFQINQWHRKLPDHQHWDPSMMNQPDPTPISPGTHRLRVILYLRRNSMLIHLYRPVLYSATSIVNNRASAQEVVNVAKETIRVLTYLNQTSTVYRKAQIMFNAFLTSALAVLFLAVSHTPALFAEQIREEFYMALELIRGFSKGSWAGKRLWKTIRHLKEVAPRLGLIKQDRQARTGSERTRDDGSRSAAVAMAGLAGHNIDEMALYGRHQSTTPSQHWSGSAASISSSSPENMANDLTTLFEAAERYSAAYNGQNGTQANGASGQYPVAPTSSEGQAPPIPQEAMFGGDEELSRIMRELF